MKWYDLVGLHIMDFITGALLMGVCQLLFHEELQKWLAFFVGLIIVAPFMFWNFYACEKYFRLKK
jgi:hypothetical protein